MTQRVFGRSPAAGAAALVMLFYAGAALAQQQPAGPTPKDAAAKEAPANPADSAAANPHNEAAANQNPSGPVPAAAPEAPRADAAPESPVPKQPASPPSPGAAAPALGARAAGAAPAMPVEEITVLGSRRQIASPMSTLAPVDVIEIGAVGNQGAADMSDMLRTFVPAFNVNQQPISDAATMIRPVNLRGLPPDMTVVLLNGKRHHRGAVIAFLGGGVSDGAQGVDVSVIPSIALSRVEVLRDGAAAQYGADAIAGVMNFVLKDNREGLTFQAQYGSTYAGDGDRLLLAGNWGLPLTEDGFLNLSLEFSNSDPTSRSVQRADASALRESGNFAVPEPAQIWGSPEVSDNIKLFANAGLRIDDTARTYLFGNYAHRFVLGGFYYRNPDVRSGVFSNDSGQTRLVGTLRPGAMCESVPVGDAAALQRVIDNPDCFVFNELFPGGFTPQFGGDVDDASLVGGVRGQLDSGLRWDLSAGVGQSKATFLIKNTVNASLGPDTPTQFRPGAYRQTDQNLNFDVVYLADVGLFHSPLNVASGLEFREEKFTIFEGDRQSFELGPLFDQGFSFGSNGFPGFSTDQAGAFKRRNVAAYLDFEADVLTNWVAGLAGRVEQFDTFGNTANIKGSTRFTLLEHAGAVDTLALRATAGTGFRAPTPGQANVTNVTTVGKADGTLVNRVTLPPTHPIARFKGGLELQPETSLNVGGGVVAKLLDAFSLTADYYHIRVRDRISQSGTQTLTAGEAQQLRESGVRIASDFEEFRFFTNAFDTTTQGIDLVGSYKLDWRNFGHTDFTLAYNWNRTSVDDFLAGVIDDQRIAELEEYLPQHRTVLSGSHSTERLRFLARLNFYSGFKHPETGDEANDFGPVYAPMVLADFEAAYAVDENLTWVVGAQNAFNTFPDQHRNPTATGNLYPENSPAGLYGGFWYTRLQTTF